VNLTYQCGSEHIKQRSTFLNLRACIPTTVENLIPEVMKAALYFALAVALTPRSVSAWGNLGHETTGWVLLHQNPSIHAEHF
jgi:hypothetical protein